MKLWPLMGIVMGVAVFVIALVVLLLFYYRPTFEWVR